jgi:hypothetical protein
MIPMPIYALRIVSEQVLNSHLPSLDIMYHPDFPQTQYAGLCFSINTGMREDLKLKKGLK